jgi:2-C-methyl-D-erythritol 2,4-cyclodiphosphate synthase/2-C-methyl-D-erythritol 4-phosphate cytidylyltransferase/2-C-methyl-D-erythritol 2,4-cyclodiphosphate synthase
VIKTGLGYDVHKLKKGRRFLLGGIEIPFSRGEDGHSDGDALIHAICDALLGASALGDIGELFPPSDSKWKDANSMDLLQNVYTRVKQSGWKIINLDCVIICEQPKILPYRDVIRKSLAELLEIQPDCVFIKGKTAEGMGAVGKGKAIEVLAQCLLEKDGNNGRNE